MTIEVTGCHDCPFRYFSDMVHNCRLDVNPMAVIRCYIDEKIPHSCPLKQETITIKLKEDEKQENSQ